MWDNIGKVRENRSSMELLPDETQNNTKATEAHINESIVVNADCRSSTKGLFLGKEYI